MSTKFTAMVDGQLVHCGSADEASAVQAWADRVAGELAKVANDNQVLADRAAQIVDRDRQISETQAQIDQLQQQVDGQQKLIIQLGDLKALCQSRLRVDPVGRTVVDMMRDALGKKLGPQAIAGKDDAYIAARFDMVLDSAAMAAPPADPFRQAALNGIRTGDADTVAAAHKQMIADMTSGWQRPAPDDESLN